MTHGSSAEYSGKNDGFTTFVDLELASTLGDFYKHGRYLKLANFLPQIVPTITCSITRLDRSDHRSDLNTNLRFACATFIGSVLSPVDVLLDITADHLDQKAWAIQESYIADAGENIRDSNDFYDYYDYREEPSPDEDIPFAVTSMRESITDFAKGVVAMTRFVALDYISRFRK